MEKKQVIVLNTLLIMLLMYLGFSLTFLSLDAVKWSEATRGVFCIFELFTLLIGMGIYYETK